MFALLFFKAVSLLRPCSPNLVSSLPTYKVDITLLNSSEFLFITLLHYGKVRKSHYFLLKIFLSPCKWYIVLCKRQFSRGKIKFLYLDFNKEQEETFSKWNVIMRQINTSCNEHLRPLNPIEWKWLFAYFSNNVKMGLFLWVGATIWL